MIKTIEINGPTRDNKNHVKTSNLGHDWRMSQYNNNGVETLVIWNAVTDEQIDLPNESVKTLRQIFKSHS